jgi:rubredoxin
MPRELTWLEDNTFAAWSCTACGWIISNPGPTVSGRAPEKVREDFAKHECGKFPRAQSRPKREGLNP